jgi:hypothetical protein
MMAIQFEAIAQIRLVRGLPVVTCVEMHSLAMPSLGLLLQPRQQSASPSATVLGVQGNQVIEVQDFSPGHRIHESETGSGYDDVVGFDKYNLVSLLALHFPTSNELDLGQMWAQFMEDRPATADVLVSRCLADFWCGL